jgi:hypothetical protein
MTDLYGATSLPVVAPAENEAISDPALGTLLRWAQAVIEFECATAWSVVAPNEPIVRKGRPWKPEQSDFGADTDLPALFCYSDDEYFGGDRTISLLWVFPPGPYYELAQRSGILKGLRSALHKALEMALGRHPAWVDPEDTDEDAAAYGSSLLDRGGFVHLRFTDARHAEIQIDTSGAGATYPAVMFEFEAREYFTQGAPTGLGSAIQMTFNQNGSASPAFVQTDIEPDA